MTPSEINKATQQQRVYRLVELRNRAQTSLVVEQKITSDLLDEALLIMLETIRYAQLNPPPKLPERPIAYLEALLMDPEPGSFMQLLQPRASEWVQWCKEFESPETSQSRKEQLRALLRKVGLISRKRNGG